MMRRLVCLLFFGVGNVINPTLKAQAISGGDLVSTAKTTYPLTAKAAGIEGKVTVKGVLGKDGKMRDVRATKGPKELQQAAVDTVMLWVYHPYLQNGVPVEVDTTITVNFTLGDKKHKEAAQAEAKVALAKAAAEASASAAVRGDATKETLNTSH